MIVNCHAIVNFKFSKNLSSLQNQCYKFNIGTISFRFFRGHEVVDHAKQISREFEKSVIQPKLFVMFALDNCNHSMESIFGTVHCINGIMIQVKSTRDNLPSLHDTQDVFQNQVVAVKRKRLFQPTLKNLSPC